MDEAGNVLSDMPEWAPVPEWGVDIKCGKGTNFRYVNNLFIRSSNSKSWIYQSWICFSHKTCSLLCLLKADLLSENQNIIYDSVHNCLFLSKKPIFSFFKISKLMYFINLFPLFYLVMDPGLIVKESCYTNSSCPLIIKQWRLHLNQRLVKKEWRPCFKSD